MNFYKLRVINTLLLFLVGVLLGVYIGLKKDYFKFFLDGFQDYKPIYYGKKNINDNTDFNYKSVYYNKKTDNKTENSTLNFRENFKENKVKDSFILENLKNSSNPMEDELDLYFDGLNEQVNDFVDVYDFILDPLKNKGKKIRAERLLLLKGEKKGDLLLMYFFLKAYEKEYYLNVYSLKTDFSKTDDFKIGYYYKLDFISNLGSLLEGNKLLTIESTGEKAEWATGISAF